MIQVFRLVFSLLAVACTLLPFSANAASPDMPTVKTAAFGSKPYGSHLEPILKTINATPEQRQKITQVVTDFKPKIEPIVIKYREKRDQFLAAMTTGKASEDIMSKQEEMNQLSSFITNQYCLMNLKVRGLLKPDQIEPYENYRRKQGWVKN